MRFNKEYFKPYKDIFGYYKEIQNINSGYRLFFNQKNKIFAIVNIRNNFEICGQFNAISDIILQNLRFSKIENYNLILNHLEEFNLNLERKKLNKKKDVSNSAISDFITISKRSSSVNKNDINKIIGATQC